MGEIGLALQREDALGLVLGLVDDAQLCGLGHGATSFENGCPLTDGFARRTADTRSRASSGRFDTVDRPVHTRRGAERPSAPGNLRRPDSES